LRLGSLSVASYDSLGYGEDILTHLYTGMLRFIPTDGLLLMTSCNGPVNKAFIVVKREPAKIVFHLLLFTGRCYKLVKYRLPLMTSSHVYRSLCSNGPLLDSQFFILISMPQRVIDSNSV
jgi:hypothetical protein